MFLIGVLCLCEFVGKHLDAKLIPVSSLLFVCLMHSGKDFIRIKHQYQSKQGELPGKEQGHVDLFCVLLPVLKEEQGRGKTKGWLEELSWSHR